MARISAIIAGSCGAEGGVVRRICELGAAVWRSRWDFRRGGIAFTIPVCWMFVIGVGGVREDGFFVFLEGVAEVARGGVCLQHVDMHVVVGFADGGVGGRVGPGLVVVGGGCWLGGFIAEAGEAEGGRWTVWVVVVVGW